MSDNCNPGDDPNRSDNTDGGRGILASGNLGQDNAGNPNQESSLLGGGGLQILLHQVTLYHHNLFLLLTLMTMDQVHQQTLTYIHLQLPQKLLKLVQEMLVQLTI